MAGRLGTSVRLEEPTPPNGQRSEIVVVMLAVVVVINASIRASLVRRDIFCKHVP